MTNMRAKVRVSGVQDHDNGEGVKTSETLTFNAVAASNYPEDGSDENNTFAKWSPSAEFKITVANPALWGKFEVNKEYYVDFSLVVMEDLVVVVPQPEPAADPAPASDPAPATE